MSVALIGGCNRCGLNYNNPIDYSKEYKRWEEKYFFGLFKSVYKEEELCTRCLPIIQEKYSTANIRKNKIKKLL